MKRLLLVFSVCFASFASEACAQDLFKAVYFNSFETEAERNACTQVGSGEYVADSLSSFGMTYHNNPAQSSAVRTNYLLLPEDVLTHSGESQEMTICFWVNNRDNDLVLYHPLFAAYAQKNTTNTWPMFVAQARGLLQINCWGWTDFAAANNDQGSNTESIDWLKNSDWHLYTATLTATNAVVYVDGEVMNSWTEDGSDGHYIAGLFNGGAANALPYVCIGGNQAWDWADSDCQYYFDDIAIYDRVLSKAEINLIKNMKLGQLDPDDLLTLAQTQFEEAIDALSSYAGQIMEEDGFTALGTELDDYAMTYEVEEETVEAYNKATQEVNAKLAEAKNIVKTYKTAETAWQTFGTWAEAQQYPGYADFAAAWNTLMPDKAEVVSLEPITKAQEEMPALRAAYLYSQTLPADGTGIVVSKLIQHPWFCNEEAEPTLSEDGLATYPVESPADYLNKGGWTNECTVTGTHDCTMYYTQGRTTWNNYHASTEVGAVLDIHQQLSGLRPGYYSVSGDMVSSAAATDNVVYGKTPDGQERISQVFSGNGWDGVESGIGLWETLTSDKILVGEDSILTIGATATTNGTAYAGWYCVTNFTLTYFGTEVNLDADVEAKYEEAKTLIENTLILKGDIADMKGMINFVYSSTTLSAYEKISQLTTCISMINRIAEAEQAFTGLADYQAYIDSEDDEDLRGIAQMYYAVAQALYYSNDMRYTYLDGITQIVNEYKCYAETAKAAKVWNTASVMALLSDQFTTLRKMETEAEEFARYADDLIEAMIGSVGEKQASEVSPVDMSFVLKNADFSNGTLKWNGSVPAVDKGVAEFYNTTFDMYQTTHTLPRGKFVLKLNGFYRDGDNATAESNYMQGAFARNAMMYVDQDVETIAPWAAEPVSGEPLTEDGDGEYTSDYENYLPNTMAAAALYFGAGHYAGNELVFRSEGVPVVVGIAKTTTADYDWTLFDKFQLLYMGQTAEAKGDTATYLVSCGVENFEEDSWWTQFSDYYEVAQGNTAHFQFMNYSDEGANYHNWLIIATTPYDRDSTDYSEYFALRADNYGWGSNYTSLSLQNTYDWDTFKQDMNGSFVDMYVTYRDGRIAMNATITSKAKEEGETAEGKAEYSYSFKSLGGIDAEKVQLFFTVENAYIVGEETPTGIEQSSIRVTGYGLQVTDCYDLTGRRIANGQQPTAKGLPKGLYIVNGRKVFSK